jgi:hypothetical protein
MCTNLGAAISADFEIILTEFGIIETPFGIIQKKFGIIRIIPNGVRIMYEFGINQTSAIWDEYDKKTVYVRLIPNRELLIY